MCSWSIDSTFAISSEFDRYYSTSIFCNIGVKERYISTTIVGTINFLTTILAVFLVDKVSI